MKLSLLICVVTCLLFTNVNAQTGWTLQTNPLGTSNLGKVQFVSPIHGWISVSNSSKLLSTTNSGSVWSVQTMSTIDTVWSFSDPAVNLSFIDTSTGWVLKSFGTDFGDTRGAVVYKTIDGGNNWTRKVLSQSNGDFGFYIQFVDATTGWLAVANLGTVSGSLYKTTDGGTNWNPISSGSFILPYFINANDGFAINVGPDIPPPYVILQTSDGGVNWTTQYVDTTQGALNALHFTDVNNGWVVGSKGKIFKTSNGGTNWHRISHPSMNTNPNSKALHFISSTIGWIGTDDGMGSRKVIHTTDAGNSWSIQNVPVTSSIFSISFADISNGWLVSDYGVIAKYSTGVGVKNNYNNPNQFYLNQNYPNPFNPSTVIKWQSPVSGHQTLKVYDLLGNEVVALLNEYKTAGSYEVEFNASNLTSGVYFYRLTAGTFTETKKLVLLR
ncbi:MAG: YCF48-related protein [Bacteroidota bacterium]|nr:YCF48-related protein [Bacteroidota bacterium]